MLTPRQHSAIAHLHSFQFTVAHALGFSIFTSRLLATYLNTGVIQVSRNHTLQILHKNSSLHWCTLATNSFLHNSQRHAVSYRELTSCGCLPPRTRKRASVSLINPWSHTRKTQLFYCCVTAGHAEVTWSLPTLAVAWSKHVHLLPSNGNMFTSALRSNGSGATRRGRLRFLLLLRNCRVYRGAAYELPELLIGWGTNKNSQFSERMLGHWLTTHF
jgi:hypothetical protein